MATPNSVFTELVSTTLRDHARDVVDNVITHVPVLKLMKARGNIKDGGTEIALPIVHSENSNYQRYSGYDALSQNATESISSAKFDWMQAAINVTASGREIRINSGKNQMIDLVRARKKVAVTTATNKFAIDLYSDGALTNQIGGFASIIPSSAGGTVGGIDSSTYTFWQSKVTEVTGSGATYSTLRTAMNTTWMSQTIGADEPDLLVMSHDFYAIFEAGLQDLQRYAQADTGALGFNALRYKSAPVVFDTNTNFGTTAEKCMLLNTKYLYLVQHSDAKWSAEEARTPTNQDAIIVPMFWMGNLCTDNRRMLGVVIDAT